MIFGPSGPTAAQKSLSARIATFRHSGTKAERRFDLLFLVIAILVQNREDQLNEMSTMMALSGGVIGPDAVVELNRLEPRLVYLSGSSSS